MLRKTIKFAVTAYATAAVLAFIVGLIIPWTVPGAIKPEAVQGWLKLLHTITGGFF